MVQKPRIGPNGREKARRRRARLRKHTRCTVIKLDRNLDIAVLDEIKRLNKQIDPSDKAAGALGRILRRGKCKRDLVGQIAREFEALAQKVYSNSRRVMSTADISAINGALDALEKQYGTALERPKRKRR